MYRSSTMGRRGGPILIAVGVLQLVLGAGFALALGTMPYAGPWMLLTGAVLGVVGLALVAGGVVSLRRARDQDRISATGIPATGQITGLTQTGMQVNEQPVIAIEMLVHAQGRAAYPVRVREVVPLLLLGSLQQGSLPLRVDPAKPDRVVIQWDQVGIGPVPLAPNAVPSYLAPYGPGAPPGPGAAADETLAQVAAAMPAATGAAPVFAKPAQAGLSIEQLRAHLRANGIAGVARIDQLADSGSTVGDERLFTMTTTVFVPEQIPYTSGPSAAMVPLEKVPRIAVGVELPVKVAPDNPNLVMFEWERV
jgi:hypothetical protein